MESQEVFVSLGEDEWGSEKMLAAAALAAEEHSERPLRVCVYEHGGWYLWYAFGAPEVPDGTIVGSANEMAAYPPNVHDYWRRENQAYRDRKARESAEFNRRFAIEHPDLVVA
jgi:hypothetical protein